MSDRAKRVAKARTPQGVLDGLGVNRLSMVLYVAPTAYTLLPLTVGSGEYKANVWATPRSLRTGAEAGRGDSASGGVDANGMDGAGSRERKPGSASRG